MSYQIYVPLTATAATKAANDGKELLQAWKDHADTLPESMPMDYRDALADIFKRAYHLSKRS